MLCAHMSCDGGRVTVDGKSLRADEVLGGIEAGEQAAGVLHMYLYRKQSRGRVGLVVAEIDGDFISKYGPPQIPVLGVETDGIAMNEVLKVGFVGEALQAMVVHPMHIRANPGFAPPRWARTG